MHIHTKCKKQETTKLSDGSSVITMWYPSGSDKLCGLWYNAADERHRDHGLPSVLCSDGYESFWEHGVFLGKKQVKDGRR